MADGNAVVTPTVKTGYRVSFVCRPGKKPICARLGTRRRLNLAPMGESRDPYSQAPPYYD